MSWKLRAYVPEHNIFTNFVSMKQIAYFSLEYKFNTHEVRTPGKVSQKNKRPLLITLNSSCKLKTSFLFSVFLSLLSVVAVH